MSQVFKYNDYELECDFLDVDFYEKCTQVAKAYEEKEQKIPKTGDTITIIKAQCKNLADFFDDIYGKGTAFKMFKGRTNLRELTDAYLTFCEEMKRQTQSFTDSREARLNRLNQATPKNKKYKKR